MKKCLFINNAYPTLQNPNYSTYTKSIEDCIRKGGIEEIDLLVIRFQKQITPLYKALKYFQFWLRLLFVNLKRYDIVYINQPPFAWPLFINISYDFSKLFCHWHGDEVATDRSFLNITRPFVVRKCKMCTHIVPSQYFKGVVSGKLGIDNSNIVVSPSGGVDTNAFMCEQRVHKDSIVIGFSSGMTKRKGSNIVMSLIDRSEDIENSVKHKVFFNIIDYGDDMHLYKDKLIRRSNVSLIPRMPKEKMPSFYNGIDILLIGSNSSESLGLVVLEAMSCGKPVITFKLFAFPEFVIPGVSGELVDYCPNEKENVSQFMDAIEKVANSYGDYNPRKIVTERYSSEHVVEQYKELFTN